MHQAADLCQRRVLSSTLTTGHKACDHCCTRQSIGQHHLITGVTNGQHLRAPDVFVCQDAEHILHAAMPPRIEEVFLPQPQEIVLLPAGPNLFHRLVGACHLHQLARDGEDVVFPNGDSD